jgi:hypothetical protein
MKERSVPRAVLASRRTHMAAVGATGLCLTVVLAAVLPGTVTRPRGVPRAAVVTVARPAPAPVTRSHERRPARPGDPAALAYYARRDPAHAGHVAEVVWTGPMLRVYTDLPASAADSRTAIALCETAAAYAEEQDRPPAVFVHADRAAGYPVLANKMNAGDDCRLDRVP